MDHITDEVVFTYTVFTYDNVNIRGRIGFWIHIESDRDWITALSHRAGSIFKIIGG